ncbi:MAG: hypothetical protein WKG07_29945 [Hymenobacter sp.]
MRRGGAPPIAVLFIFAGAAAEFALNKAVDWLYFTGRLPADPLGRLFSTVDCPAHRVCRPAPGPSGPLPALPPSTARWRQVAASASPPGPTATCCTCSSPTPFEP